MRLINADKLILSLLKCARDEHSKCAMTTWTGAYEAFIDIIENAPAVEAMPGEQANKMEETISELKPCPFCGWVRIVDGGFLHYRCTCSACGASTKEYPTWDLAVEAWNRRADNETN